MIDPLTLEVGRCEVVMHVTGDWTGSIAVLRADCTISELSSSC
jgi:hypothetical protein